MFIVLSLTVGVMAFSVLSQQLCYDYADYNFRREMRIQLAANVHSCLETATLMFAKDYFLNGEVALDEFECTVNVSRPLGETVIITGTSTLNNLAMRGSRILNIGYRSIVVGGNDAIF